MFYENLKTIALQVSILYIIAGVGFVADKTGVFPQKSAKKVIDLLFNIILPVAIIHTFMNMEYTEEHIKGLFIAFACAAATHAFGIIIAAVFFRKRYSRLERGIYRYATVLSNAAFLALPLAQSVIGTEGVFYCAVYVGMFNIIAFTYGIHEISGHKAKIDLKKIILNPGSISVIIGIPLFLLQIKVPYIIDYPMQLVGSINSPLAMIVFGTFLANSNFKNIIIKKELYLISFLRLIVIPLCMMGVFRLCGVHGDLLVAMIISSAAPTATNTAMYAAKYDNDAALGSEIAAQSSVLSVLSMPIIVAIASVI